MNANQTKSERSEHLAGAIFDEVLVPLAQARRASGEPAYFPLWREGNAASYFEPPAVATMSPADFESQGGGTAGELIGALTAYWARQGETQLAAMTPRLTELAAALGEEAAVKDGEVDILCYTLF